MCIAGLHGIINNQRSELLNRSERSCEFKQALWAAVVRSVLEQLLFQNRTSQWKWIALDVTSCPAHISCVHTEFVLVKRDGFTFNVEWWKAVRFSSVSMDIRRCC